MARTPAAPHNKNLTIHQSEASFRERAPTVEQEERKDRRPLSSAKLIPATSDEGNVSSRLIILGAEGAATPEATV